MAVVAAEVPGAELVLAAMRRATARRQAVYAADARYAHLTPVALRERVVGLPARPAPRPGGWWAIGRIVDDVGDLEWRVWMHPQQRLVRMAPRRLPQPPPPVPWRRPDGRYYDGTRRRWVDPAADAAASGDGLVGGAADRLVAGSADGPGGGLEHSPAADASEPAAAT